MKVEVPSPVHCTCVPFDLDFGLVLEAEVECDWAVRVRMAGGPGAATSSAEEDAEKASSGGESD